MDIPAGPAGLTADWLTDALREGGAIGAAAVASFEAAPLAEDGGHYGQLARLRLEYDPDEPGAPQSLVAKFSSAARKMRERPNTIAAYEREVRFYQRLAHRTSLPTPVCHYSDIHTATGMHVLLLEDLGTAGVGSRVRGCSAEQAELAIHQVAGFHADWWESPVLEELGWLTSVPRDLVGIRDAHDRWWPDFLKQTGDRLPDRIREIGERLGHHRAEMMRRPRGTSPRTLRHGDYSLDNLVFGAPNGGAPITVIDWQRMGIGSGIGDVSYFLGENLDPEVRLAVEMELLGAYHRILVDNGVEGYGFEQCLRGYRLSLLDRLGSLISTIAAMPFTKEQIRIHVEVLLPRVSAAILDNGAGELLA